MVAIAAAGITAAGALGSAAMGGQGQGGGSTSTVNPQSVQYSNQLGNAAQGLYDKQTQLGPYSGQFYSPTTQGQQYVAGNAQNYANGTTPGNMEYSASQDAAAMASAGRPFTDNAYGLAGGVGTPQMNAGMYGTLQGYGSGGMTTLGATPGLSSTLNSAATNAAGQLGNYGSTLMSNAAQGQQDATSRIAADAQQYANAPQVNQDVAATNASIAQTLNEQTLPGINRQAAMGGSLNSSRAGAANAEAQGQAATSEGMADASIRNNALNTGMGTASGLYTSGLNESNLAASAGYGEASGTALNTAQQQTGLNEFNTGTQIGAANSGLSQSLGYNQAGVQNRLAGNAQLGQAASTGLYGTTIPGQIAGQTDAVGQSGANVAQNNANAVLAGQYQQWQQQYQVPAQTFQNYASGIQAANGIQAGNTVTNNLPNNTIGQITGGLGAAAGIYQNLSQNPNGNNNSTANGNYWLPNPNTGMYGMLGGGV